MQSFQTKPPMAQPSVSMPSRQVISRDPSPGVRRLLSAQPPSTHAVMEQANSVPRFRSASPIRMVTVHSGEASWAPPQVKTTSRIGESFAEAGSVAQKADLTRSVSPGIRRTYCFRAATSVTAAPVLAPHNRPQAPTPRMLPAAQTLTTSYGGATPAATGTQTGSLVGRATSYRSNATQSTAPSFMPALNHDPSLSQNGLSHLAAHHNNNNSNSNNNSNNNNFSSLVGPTTTATTAAAAASAAASAVAVMTGSSIRGSSSSSRAQANAQGSTVAAVVRSTSRSAPRARTVRVTRSASPIRPVASFTGQPSSPRSTIVAQSIKTSAILSQGGSLVRTTSPSAFRPTATVAVRAPSRGSSPTRVVATQQLPTTVRPGPIPTSPVVVVRPRPQPSSLIQPSPSTVKATAQGQTQQTQQQTQQQLQQQQQREANGSLPSTVTAPSAACQAAPEPELQANQRSAAAPVQAQATDQLAEGATLKLGSQSFRVLEQLGSGSYSVVWLAEELKGPAHLVGTPQRADPNRLVALKDVQCRDHKALRQALFEVRLMLALEKEQLMQDSFAKERLRLPRCFTYEVHTTSIGSAVRTAMTRLPGDQLDSWLVKAAEATANDSTHWKTHLAEGSKLARAMVRQLGPTLHFLSTMAYHRDVNSHNIMIRAPLPTSGGAAGVGGPGGPGAGAGDSQASFYLYDLGLAVDAESWNYSQFSSPTPTGGEAAAADKSLGGGATGANNSSTNNNSNNNNNDNSSSSLLNTSSASVGNRLAGSMAPGSMEGRFPGLWRITDIGGDCRYWPPGAWMLHCYGAEYLEDREEFCRQYRTRLDIHSLGITALEVLCSPAIPNCEANDIHHSGDSSVEPWTKLVQAWQRYRETVGQWWSMIYNVFSQGGDFSLVHTWFTDNDAPGICIRLLNDLHQALFECIPESDPATARTLRVLVELTHSSSTLGLLEACQFLEEAENESTGFDLFRQPPHAIEEEDEEEEDNEGEGGQEGGGSGCDPKVRSGSVPENGRLQQQQQQLQLQQQQEQQQKGLQVQQHQQQQQTRQVVLQQQSQNPEQCLGTNPKQKASEQRWIGKLEELTATMRKQYESDHPVRRGSKGILAAPGG